MINCKREASNWSIKLSSTQLVWGPIWWVIIDKDKPDSPVYTYVSVKGCQVVVFVSPVNLIPRWLGVEV